MVASGSLVGLMHIFFFFSTGPPQQLQSTQKSILGFERWQKDILDLLSCTFYFFWTDQLKEQLEHDHLQAVLVLRRGMWLRAGRRRRGSLPVHGSDQPTGDRI